LGAGMYTAVVTASNSVSTITATTTVTVDDSISGLAASNSSPTVLGGSTAFTATVVSGTNVLYTWDFGDGNTGTGATANHSYLAAGVYTAVVTATNSISVLVAHTVVTIEPPEYLVYLPLIAR
jgi:PKD repeat protein